MTKCTGKKENIVTRVAFEVQKHEQYCPGNVPICLGPIENFDLSESGDIDIFLQNGRVYLFISCPDFIHERTQRNISRDIEDGLAEMLGCPFDDVFQFQGKVACPVQNQVGGHGRWNKQPDDQIVLAGELEGEQRFPVIAVEVASRHEDLFKLLSEGALWMNSKTDVVLVVLVKLWIEEKALEIFILGRKDHKAEKNGAEHIHELSDKDVKAKSDMDLEEIFGYAILYHQLFTEQSQEPVPVQLDASKLFARSTYNLDSGDTPLTFRFTKTLKNAWKNFNATKIR